MDIRAIDTRVLSNPSAPRTAQLGSSAPAESAAVPPEPGKSAGADLPYPSPVLRYDQAARLAVLYFRDSDTGETTQQIPRERVVEEYRRTASRSSSATTTGATATANGESQPAATETAAQPARPSWYSTPADSTSAGNSPAGGGGSFAPFLAPGYAVPSGGGSADSAPSVGGAPVSAPMGQGSGGSSGPTVSLTV